MAVTVSKMWKYFSMNLGFWHHVIVIMYISHYVLQEVVGRVLGGDAHNVQKIQKGMIFANKKLTDLRSEERRRVNVYHF